MKGRVQPLSKSFQMFVLVCVMAIAAWGCGGDSNGEGEETPTGASNRDEAGARVQNAMEPPEFIPPGGPIDVTSLKGKSLWYIAVSLGIPYVADCASGLEEAAKEVGVEVTTFDGKGQLAEQSKGVELAIARGADVIVLQAIDPRLIAGPLEKAGNASIPVIDSGSRDADAPKPETIWGNAEHYGKQYKQLMVDYAIAETEGDVHGVYLFDPVIEPWIYHGEAMQEELAELNPSGTLELVEYSLANPQELLGKVNTTLTRNPEINWIFPAFDGAVVAIIQAMRQADVVGDVRLVGCDGVAANLDLVRAGDVQESDIALPAMWFGWAEMDLAARAMLGEEPTMAIVPFRFVTAENLPPTNDYDTIMETDFREEFRKLWGLAQ